MITYAPALPVDQREDIVQDILTTVHAKRHTWQQTKPILPWLYAIARHRLIDHLRRQQRGAATFHDIDLDSIAEITAGPDHNPDLKIDLEKGIDQLEGRAGTVVRAIGLDGKDIRQTRTRPASVKTPSALLIVGSRNCGKEHQPPERGET